MNVWGKIVGGFFGLLLAGAAGLLLGVFIGHFFDKGLYKQWQRSFSGRQAQQVFFDTTFLVMGHIAKLDGRVSRAEIQIAQRTMSRLGLNATMRQQAIRCFNQGKQPSFNLEQALQRLAQVSRQDRALLQMFVEIQTQAALAEGLLTGSKQRALEKICRYLGAHSFNFAFFEHLFTQTYRASAGSRYREPPRPPVQADLQDAYSRLGISEQASHAEVKRAYRRLMSQNHPDKLLAKGLPEQMIKLATEKTQNIKAAYEHICTARGL